MFLTINLIFYLLLSLKISAMDNELEKDLNNQSIEATAQILNITYKQANHFTQINENEIKNISFEKTPTMEIYKGNLLNGDTITCANIADTIYCIRGIKEAPYPITMFLDAKYFYIIMNKYKIAEDNAIQNGISLEEAFNLSDIDETKIKNIYLEITPNAEIYRTLLENGDNLECGKIMISGNSEINCLRKAKVNNALINIFLNTKYFYVLQQIYHSHK